MRKNKELHESDIVLVWRGSYRIGDVGQIHEKDIKSIFTGELQFFRIVGDNKYGLTNHNLFIILKSKLVHEQFNHLIFIDTTLPTLYNRWKKLKIPLYSRKHMANLNEKAEHLFNLRKEYWSSMENIDVENIN